MTDLTVISIVSTAENALNRLKKAEVAVFNCKKEGAEFIFSIKSKDIKKVFAIFNKPCYNIKVKKHGLFRRILSFAALRVGLLVGAIAFVALAAVSNSFVLKIEVSGSGSYLEPEIRRIVLDEGAAEFKSFSAFNGATATGRILALPQVTYCNILKKGSVLIVDVQVDEEHYASQEKGSLLSDCDGVVKNIVAVCGTPAVNVGDAVKRGDALIYAHTVIGEEQQSCLAVGYVEIELYRTVEYFADEDNEQNLKEAYASCLIENVQITERKHTVKPTEGGVIYVIEFTCLHKLSINLN